MAHPHISKRAQELPSSPIRGLSPLAAAASAEGVHVYHVNVGQPDLPVPREIADAIKIPANGIVPYSPSRGMSEALQAWSTYYQALGINLDPTDIVVTTGGVEAIGFALVAVTDPGDELLVFDPTYASYLGYAVSSNITLVPVRTDPPDYHLPASEVIEHHITPRTRAIVLINPNNPTGTVYTRDELAVLMDIAERHGLFVIADETYRELVFDGREHVSALDFPAMTESVILVDSASKRFSATGLRVGCLASKNRDVMTAVLRLAEMRISSPTIEQTAVVPLLRNPEPYTTWLRGVYEARRDATYNALQQLPGVTVSQPEGAFYALVGLPVTNTAEFARWLLADFRSSGETVMVAPGTGFYVTPGMGSSEVRIAYVLAEDALRRAVDILGEALASYPEQLTA